MREDIDQYPAFSIFVLGINTTTTTNAGERSEH